MKEWAFQWHGYHHSEVTNHFVTFLSQATTGFAGSKALELHAADHNLNSSFIASSEQQMLSAREENKTLRSNGNRNEITEELSNNWLRQNLV